jgi:hypothetical protein
MARLVCLANSNKHGERCVAGKLLETGRWVRPVSAAGHGEIPWKARLICGREPQLLDILDIPLEGQGPDYGCQPENRLLAPGAWQKAGSISAAEVMKYVDAVDERPLFYNYVDRVPMTAFRRIPPDRWRSLQLVHCCHADFHRDARKPEDWRATFEYRGAEYADLKVTDPVAETRLGRGERLDGPCVLTVSLGGAFRPTNTSREYCFKLVAAVLRLKDFS